jgi:hypothetical protein
VKTTSQTLKFLSPLLLLSILVSQSALAAEPVPVVAEPAKSAEPLPAVEPVESATPVKAAEPVKDTKSLHVSGNIGIDSIKDATVAGQESNQRDTTFGISLETENYTFEVNIPYIQRTAPSGTIAHGDHNEHDRKPATAAPATIVSNAGLGDVTTSVQYALLKEENAPLSLSVKGGFKLATADLAKGLGTGQNDYSVELKTSKSVGEFTGDASIGYALLGSPGVVQKDEKTNTSTSIYFNNILYGSVGGTYQFSENLETNVKLDMGQAAVAGGFQQRDLSAAMDYKFSKNRSLHMQVMKSVTAGLNILGAYASLSFGLY